MAAKTLADREALDSLRASLGFAQKTPCTDAENAEYDGIRKNGGALPEGVFLETDFYDSGASGRYYRVRESDLTEGERKELVALMQLKRLKSLNGHLIFYTTLIILQIAVLAIALLAEAYGVISLVN